MSPNLTLPLSFLTILHLTLPPSLFYLSLFISFYLSATLPPLPLNCLPSLFTLSPSFLFFLFFSCNPFIILLPSLISCTPSFCPQTPPLLIQSHSPTPPSLSHHTYQLSPCQVTVPPLRLQNRVATNVFQRPVERRTGVSAPSSSIESLRAPNNLNQHQNPSNKINFDTNTNQRNQVKNELA